MEQTKACRVCSVLKSITEFRKDRNDCKSCEAARKKISRVTEKKSQASDDRSEMSVSMRLFYGKLLEITSFFSDTYGPKISILDRYMAELNASYTSVKNKNYTMRFHINVTDPLKKFLQLIKSKNIDRYGKTRNSFNLLANAVALMINETVLKEEYGLDIKELAHANFYTELSNLTDIVDFLKNSYYSISERILKTGMDYDNKFDGPIYVCPIYDPYTSIITIEQNPLRFTTDQFLEEINVSLAENEYLVVQYKTVGAIENFRDKLISMSTE